MVGIELALRSEKQKTVQRKKENYKTLQLITDFEVSLMPIMAEQKTKSQYRTAKFITEHSNRLTALLVAQSQESTKNENAGQEMSA